MTQDWMCNAIDALMAHDAGATDSGVHDPNLRAALMACLSRMSDFERRHLAAEYARRYYLSDPAISAGHGIRDAIALAEWFADQGVEV